jgi:large subunit ribosomal protein L10
VNHVLRNEKERVVAELADRLRASETLIVTDYRGLSMTQIDDLRGELLKHGARFSVVKNTLTRRAAESAGADGLLALLDGPTAIAFLDAAGDPVAVAKALSAAARETRVLEIRGGVMEGRNITEADVQNLAKLPPADVLRGQVVGALAGPVITIVALFAAPLRDLIGVLDARIAQLQEQGGSEAEAPPTAESAPEAEASTAADGMEEEPRPDEAAVAEDRQTETTDEAASEATDAQDDEGEQTNQEEEE